MSSEIKFFSNYKTFCQPYNISEPKPKTDFTPDYKISRSLPKIENTKDFKINWRNK